jgi:glutamine amidotransferase
MIAVIDCGMGNLHSVRLALDRLGVEAAVIRCPEELSNAERIILPGVGAFGECMSRLRSSGVAEALGEQVLQRGKPFFGICLGMQVLARESDEQGRHAGLGWLPARVQRLQTSGHDIKVPHVGWNDVEFHRTAPLFTGLSGPAAFYFVHGYHLTPDDGSVTVATCEHGATFAAAVQWQNVFAVQFHPEKSQRNGLRLLENFLAWKP